MEYTTMADSVGEAPATALYFVPGEDFDPSDPEEVEAVKLAMDRDTFTRINRLEKEIRLLKQENARLQAELLDAEE